MATRLYGSDDMLVKDCGVAYTKAAQELGMAVSIKHFPGDGVDERDQHLVTSSNDLSCEEWDATFGEAYQASIDAGAMTVMIGHIMQPAYTRRLCPGIKDEDIMPATLAPELINGLLREKLGFNGMIVTDATTMAGFTIPLSRSKAVPYTIACGCDMFLFTKNLEEDYAFMTQGVKDGIITPERLDEAVTRILGLKAALKLPEKKTDGSIFVKPEEAKKIVGCKEHKEIELIRQIVQ
jgi:beta-N-acetylhexosaminidase